MAVVVHHGDSREVLKTLAAASIDACACDPPYALVAGGKPAGQGQSGFMGQKWDTGETAFDPRFWREVYRVLKPGAHLVAFGGTRTYHRLACAIEDAGFEIRDQLAWLYGSGFPKSHDVAKGIDKMQGAKGEFVPTGAPVKRMIPGADHHKGGWEKNNGREYVPGRTQAATDAARQWEGWGTALKPALEPIILARKPLVGTVAANVLKHGCGALNIDGCRIATQDDLNGGGYALQQEARHDGDERWRMQNGGAGEFVQPAGRWPANVIHDGSAEVVEAFPHTESTPPGNIKPSPSTADVFGKYGARSLVGHTDSGSAARFFYSSKADAEDRLGSKHPTVKPVDLMAWLCRLITPPGGTVLDPFAGSGTTGLAAMREGFDCILIEREEKYVADINRRLAWARGEGRTTALEKARLDDPKVAAKAVGADLPLFGEAS